MISKGEIIDAATAFGLTPHVVEKDYVLGWVLWGIHNHEALAESWTFKGGTCLKKCFFETYRFSEDLDFTLIDPSHLDEAFFRTVFAKIGERVYQETGIALPADYQKFEIFENPRGNPGSQVKIGYQGPISPRGRSMPRIKLDLTADECIVLPPVQSSVFHPYGDEPEDGISIRSYAYEEAFAEKVRALAERARPRDLYDVINLFRNADSRPAPAVLHDVLSQKCEYKGIRVPVLTDLEQYRGDLEAGWETMLARQLPTLPPVETFWDELPRFFAWLKSEEVPEVPAAYAVAEGEEVIRERTLRLPLRPVTQSYLEVIQFAAANRLCVALSYQRSTRLIEPYSLRRTREGNIILHAFNVDKGAHRSYRADRIESVSVTDRKFVARYEVELTPSGPLTIRPTSTRGGPASFGGLARPRRARRSGFSSGPTYVYECSYCGKHFNRKKQTSTLNPHKDKNGYPCAGRYAHWVDTRY